MLAPDAGMRRQMLYPRGQWLHLPVHVSSRRTT